MAPVLSLRRARGVALVWSDAGSGAKLDLHLYRPLLRPDELCLGHFASGKKANSNKQWLVAVIKNPQKDVLRPGQALFTPSSDAESPFFGSGDSVEGKPDMTMDIVSPAPATVGDGDDPATLPFAAPVKFLQIWTDTGSGSLESVVIFRPVAPSGYVCLGDLAVNAADLKSYNNDVKDVPYVKDVVCVRWDLATGGKLSAQPLWDDSTAGGLMGGCAKPVSFWRVLAENGLVEDDRGMAFGHTLGTFLTSRTRGREGLDLVPRVVTYQSASLSTCVKVRPVLFENQRWYPITGWGATLSTDRATWSGDGGSSYEKPFPDLAWELDKSAGESVCDADGWMYAFNISDLSHPKYPLQNGPYVTSKPGKGCYVRRRKWIGPVVSLVVGDEPGLWDGAEVAEDASVIWRAVAKNTTMEEVLMDLVSSEEK